MHSQPPGGSSSPWPRWPVTGSCRRRWTVTGNRPRPPRRSTASIAWPMAWMRWSRAASRPPARPRRLECRRCGTWRCSATSPGATRSRCSRSTPPSWSFGAGRGRSGWRCARRRTGGPRSPRSPTTRSGAGASRSSTRRTTRSRVPIAGITSISGLTASAPMRRRIGWSPLSERVSWPAGGLDASSLRGRFRRADCSNRCRLAPEWTGASRRPSD